MPAADISIITPVGRYEPEYLTEAYLSLTQLTTRSLPLTLEWIMAIDTNTVHRDTILALFPDPPFPITVHTSPHAEPQGPGTTRNVALAYVTAPYLITLDADDILIPEGIRTLYLLLQQNPDYAYAAGRTNDIDENSIFISDGPPIPYREGPIPQGHFYQYRVHHGSPPFHPCGTIMRTSIIRRIGGWPEKWRRTEDTAMWSVLTHHYRGIWSNEFVLKYRKHSSSLTHQPEYHGTAPQLLPLIENFIQQKTTNPVT